jgi:hypothetical protein
VAILRLVEQVEESEMRKRLASAALAALSMSGAPLQPSGRPAADAAEVYYHIRVRAAADRKTAPR